jgi:hypothetical protein
MPGRGFAPKDPKRLVAGDRSGVDPKTIEFVAAQQPKLPEGEDYPDWHPHTRIWWAMWKESPQAVHFMASDWDFLLETASLHTSFWRKANFNVAAELRLRVAKYGATPEDRARLRMHFADADEKDAKRPVAPVSARDRYGALKAVSE